MGKFVKYVGRKKTAKYMDAETDEEKTIDKDTPVEVHPRIAQELLRTGDWIHVPRPEA